MALNDKKTGKTVPGFSGESKNPVVLALSQAKVTPRNVLNIYKFASCYPTTPEEEKLLQGLQSASTEKFLVSLEKHKEKSREVGKAAGFRQIKNVGFIEGEEKEKTIGFKEGEVNKEAYAIDRRKSGFKEGKRKGYKVGKEEGGKMGESKRTIFY